MYLASLFNNYLFPIAYKLEVNKSANFKRKYWIYGLTPQVKKSDAITAILEIKKNLTNQNISFFLRFF